MPVFLSISRGKFIFLQKYLKMRNASVAGTQWFLIDEFSGLVPTVFRAEWLPVWRGFCGNLKNFCNLPLFFLSRKCVCLFIMCSIAWSLSFSSLPAVTRQLSLRKFPHSPQMRRRCRIGSLKLPRAIFAFRTKSLARRLEYLIHKGPTSNHRTIGEIPHPMPQHLRLR